MEKLEEIKEALAKEKGYETWTKCINDQPNCMVETLMDTVALRLYNVSVRYLAINWYDGKPIIDGCKSFLTEKEAASYLLSLPKVEGVTSTICETRPNAR